MKGLTILLLLSLGCMTSVARTLRQFEHVKWATSVPGKTCHEVCVSTRTGIAITMDEFENAESGHSLCGAMIGNKLLTGTISSARNPRTSTRVSNATVNAHRGANNEDDVCRILIQPGTSQVQTLQKGSYMCGCDTTFSAAMFEWKHIAGCPAYKQTRPTVICSGEVMGMEHRDRGITHYSIGYAVALGEFSHCATPDGTLDEFSVLCDYP